MTKPPPPVYYPNPSAPPPPPNGGNDYTAAAGSTYPSSWDGRRLTYGKHKNRKFYDTAMLDPNYVKWVVEQDPIAASPQLREYRRYLIDRSLVTP